MIMDIFFLVHEANNWERTYVRGNIVTILNNQTQRFRISD